MQTGGGGERGGGGRRAADPYHVAGWAGGAAAAVRDRGWTAARAEAGANEAATVDVAAPATGAGSEGDAGVRVGDGAAPATGGSDGR